MEMKRDFDFYEYAGVLVPGMIVVLGVGLMIPEFKILLLSKDFGVGHLGLCIILAYAAGQLIQAFGNLIENIWWRIFGGMPSDWIRTGKRKLISEAQAQAVEHKITTTLALKIEKIRDLNEKEWYSITRQIYAAIPEGPGRKRIDTFNGNYGLNRGIAASLGLLIALCVGYYGFSMLQLELWLAVGFAVGVYRMHRFGRTYARELFVQFMQTR